VATTGSAGDQLCINTIRALSIDMVQRANSGHPGLPLGAAPMAYLLWKNHLQHNPENPRWFDRDRFVMSPGHGSALLYSLLHLFGYELPMDELLRFRQWGSRTPGHPESGLTAGVEATTGPLGQGTANAVGMAMAERILAHRFNRPGHEVVNHRTYALVSDGDLMEGICYEAVSLAGHLRLGKLTFLYDSNGVTLDGPASMHWSENVAGRFEACGWQVLRVEDGDRDLDAIDGALEQARLETVRPTLIEVKTTIGYGSPKKAGSSESHGSPLGVDEVRATKQALGLDPELEFHVPAEVAAALGQRREAGCAREREWVRTHAAWAEVHPELAKQFEQSLSQDLPEGLEDCLPAFPPGEQVATRKASGKALNALARELPWLIGGDADLSCSTNTALTGEDAFDGTTGAGRNIHFGIREHAMAAIAAGFCYHGGVRPYVATFFVFSDYMRPALRLAALAHLPVIAVFTHDSVAVGEDGPTHQPVEHLMSLRAMPNLHVVRPADATEAGAAWLYALRRTRGPTALVLSRQGLPVLNESGPLERGAYILEEAGCGRPELILIATGSEVSLALAARTTLEADGVATRVVSMPCFEAFEEQSEEYRREVLPPAVRARVSVEAGATLGWERYIGDQGRSVGLDRFGASAPGDENLEQLGFHPEAVVRAAREVLSAAAAATRASER